MNDPHLTPDEEALQRWLDGTLPEAGRQALERALPEGWPAEREAAAGVRTALRQGVPASVEPPYAEFFTSQLMKKLRDEQAAAAVPAAPRFAAWLAGLFSRPLVAAGAAALVVASGAWMAAL